MKLLVISGLSGAGKSIALNVLEDLDYYCVDNLPLKLLPALVRELVQTEPVHEDVAVVIDARNLTVAFDRFPDTVREVRAQGVDCEVVFLDADDEVLLKRFSETRRKHPLTDDDVALGEAIRRERDLLGPVREQADITIDTTRTQYHELRDLIRDRLDRNPHHTLSLLFLSFGFKHGLPPDADIVFDARCLPNPYWEVGLRPLSGRDPDVAAFLDAQPAVGEMLQSLRQFLEQWIPAYEADNRSYLTVAIGCTGGNHRSVYLVERLAEHFRAKRGGVIVRHRDVT
ncbi:MAG: RNase adapter RapZ [Gammaproteobacteria bacterium]|nr:RNase adapter RapZ [Gammaproteobacteria bacterium]